MPYRIDQDNCTGCSACESECPNRAIHDDGNAFAINPDKCTECVGFFDEPQCVAACPIDDTCIIDDQRPRYVAPPGSGTPA